ncbi:hypothetical protein [Bradyrhizobium erythrophlei]|jgi:hypothetical protein|uniref:Uncharacterized protein n=1 Tax=Bradyrhizobium erythrophlei TaxID=1437360 RepID=A0A1M7U704_9BRAD|nr:hypothetical protein [Bradyrhizobium erythrophlei]SHN78738.1 hypothetical protein SAMN05444170_3771 [Bradyrhizobium erythrophlei]
MINIKALSAVALVTAALSGPAFAQDEEATAPQKPVHALRHYRHAYNQVQGPNFIAPRASENGPYFDAESFDRSRIGDHDADFNPPGN